jgi:hypothetical protein
LATVILGFLDAFLPRLSCPSFLRFESSDIHGADPSASTPHFRERLSLSLATMEEETNAEAPGATTLGQMTRDA